MADVAEQAVAQLAPQGAIVLGNSIGGFAATRMAIRRPALVKGLVIVDGGGFAARPPHVRLFCALMARQRFLRAIYPAFSRRYMRVRTDADRRARDTAIATTRRPAGVRALSELWRSFVSPEHDLRREAHTIAAPTLLIWGRRDPVIPPALRAPRSRGRSWARARAARHWPSSPTPATPRALPTTCCPFLRAASAQAQRASRAA